MDKEQKAGEIPEDEAHQSKDQIQKLTDKYEQQVDKLLDGKVKDIQEL